MEIAAILCVLAFLVSAPVFLVLWLRARKRLRRYAPLVHAEKEEQRLRAQAQQHHAYMQNLQQQCTQLHQYAENLRAHLAVLEEEQEIQESGFYPRRYDLDTSDLYKQRIEANRASQKSTVKEGAAAMCDEQWKVGGSAAKGRKMVSEQLKLMLRAFNGECDAAIARVKATNAEATDKRIRRAFETINKLGASKHCRLTAVYLELKIIELQLTYEHALKREEEKEEQRRIKEEMREEQRVQKERARAIKEAEQEEARYSDALEEARREAERATAEHRAELEAKVAQLQEHIEEIRRKRARAETTRSGHVYVLSNIGSFGEHVYKIGMTRRLEPHDRVRELSDASVPFNFDVHAMVHADDAPALEKTLHDHFEAQRVNKVNYRREYFHVTLDAIKEAVEHHHGRPIHLTRMAEAVEYRQTVAINRQAQQPNAPPAPAPMPAFATS
jgi:hypothetical protein